MLWLPIVLSTLQIAATAAPDINLPINAQVPPVARPNQPFAFTFSNSTFTSTSTLSYDLSNQPQWLGLDGISRTLSGTPAVDSVGPVNFEIVASDRDGTTSMSVTLVVSNEPGPLNGIDITSQLMAFGPLSGPNQILVAPSTSLSITFSRNTFSNTNGNTVYYATSLDRTPLPSWIQFDPSSLTFTGTAPIALSRQDTTRTYGISLSASNVVGFADATAVFQIAVELHMFRFDRSALFMNTSAGADFNDNSIATALQLDGKVANLQDIQGAFASTPAWLNLDSSTMLLSGTVPPDFHGANFTVTVYDRFGDATNTMVILQAANVTGLQILKPSESVNATAGTPFSYKLGLDTSSSGPSVTIDAGVASNWLYYNGSRGIIQGFVPLDLAPQLLIVNITASVSSQSESQILTIMVQPGPGGPFTAGRNPQTSNVATPPSVGTNSSGQTGESQRKPWIAAITLPIVALICLLTLLVCWRRRHKGGGCLGSSTGSTKHIISRPITHDSYYDEKVAVNYQSIRLSKPPQLPEILPLSKSRDKRPTSSTLSKRPSFLRPFSSGFLYPSPTHSLNKVDSDTIHEECSPHVTPKRHQESARKPERKLSKLNKRRHIRPEYDIGNQSTLYDQVMRGFGHGKPDPTRAEFTPTQFPNGLRSSQAIFGQGPPGFGTVRRSWRYFKDDSHSSDEWHTTSGSSDQDPRSEWAQKTIRPVTSTSSSSWHFKPPKPAHVRSVKTRMLSSASDRRQRYHHTRSRSSSLHPPMRPESGTLRFPRVVGVFSGRPHLSKRSSLASNNSRFQSVAPSEMGSIEFEYQDDLDRFEVRPGLSIAEHRRSSPLTDLANTLRRAEPASDDRSTLLGDDDGTIASAEEDPHDVRLMARGVRLARQIGHGHSDPTQRSLRGRIETVSSFSTGKADSKRSGSISYV